MSLDLEVDQRIHLVISGNDETLNIFKQHESYILGKVLALSWQKYETTQNHNFEHVEGSFSILIQDA